VSAVAEAVQVALPPKLKSLFIGPADVRGSWGGRGSAKTRTFAKMAAVKGLMFGLQGIKGTILCARQFMNSLDDSSLEEVKRAIEEEPFLAEYYDVGEKYIKSRDGLINFAFAGLDKSLASIKSKGRILLCWVDEAEPIIADAWSTLIPTLREEGTDWNAELWVTWNPKRKKAACEARFRFANDPLIRVVEMNWRDNPKFPAKLERERQRDLIKRPDQYEHIWEGAYVSIIEGAYYAASLTKARAEKRIGRFAADPLMTIRLFFDIGGTGARADAVSIWPIQFIGREIRVLDYYEAVGQPLATHVEWLRKRGYTPQRAQVWLPHDGEANDKVFDVSYQSALKGAGYDVTVVPNQGKGAAKQRIEAGRQHFPSIWFNAPDDVDHETTPTAAAGIEALGWYHEKKDDERNIGLGPEHDWSSHAADAFGLACVAADQIFGETGMKVEPYRNFRRAM
jgi:phage terminase large subunit